MLKRVVFLFVLLLSVVLLSVPYVLYAQTLTSREFQDLCSSASSDEIMSMLEQMEARSINIPALLCAAALNPDPRATIALIAAIQNRTFEIGLDDKGKTVLMFAAELNVPDVVAALVEAGADVNTTDFEGKKALDYALKNEKLADNVELLRMLGHKTEAENVAADVSPKEPEPVSVPVDAPAEVALPEDIGLSEDVEPVETDNPPVSSDGEGLVVSEDVEQLEPDGIFASDDIYSKPDDEEPDEEPIVNDFPVNSESPKPTTAEHVAEALESTTAEHVAESPKPTNAEHVAEAKEPTPAEHVAEAKEPIEPIEASDEQKTAHESGIMPDEFMRMCAGASAEMVLNAVENRNADVNAKDYYDVTPIMYAAEKNSDPKVIAVLVSHGADINAKDRDGKTALMYAAKSNPSAEVIASLASNNANINARDNNRMTALMYAARNNNAGVAKALVDAGAEELADKRGWTALFWAARYSQDPAVIDVLLDAGHDPQIRAHDMTTPIDHANKNPRLINTKEFLRLEEESR